MNHVKEAKIEGLEVKEEKPILDAIVEETRIQMIRDVDISLTNEIIEQLSGVYKSNYIYNIPREYYKGKPHWPACDRIEGGCPYKGKNHIHNVGVNIRGAEKIMQAYGYIDIESTRPEVYEDYDNANWWVKVTITDRRMINKREIWGKRPVLMKSGNEKKEDENAALVCQSITVRNSILYTIPSDATDIWLESYLAGESPEAAEKKIKERFQHKTQTVDESKKLTSKPKQTETPKSEEKPNSELLEMLKKFCDESKLDEQLVKDFFHYMSKTTAQIKVYLVRALTGGDMQKTIVEIENYRDTMLAAKAEEDAKQAEVEAEAEGQLVLRH